MTTTVASILYDELLWQLDSVCQCGLKQAVSTDNFYLDSLEYRAVKVWGRFWRDEPDTASTLLSVTVDGGTVDVRRFDFADEVESFELAVCDLRDVVRKICEVYVSRSIDDTSGIPVIARGEFRYM